MNVQHILAQKGNQIEAATPDLTIADAILLLASKRIGAVIVIDHTGSLAGILSERDIVRAMVAGAHALEDRVRDHMTELVVTCTSDTSVADVMDLMTRGRFRHVPVVDNGELNRGRKKCDYRLYCGRMTIIKRRGGWIHPRIRRRRGDKSTVGGRYGSIHHLPPR